MDLPRDEYMVLEAYRLVRRQGNGTLYIEIKDGVVQKFDPRPSVGSAKALNLALKGDRKLME